MATAANVFIALKKVENCAALQYLCELSVIICTSECNVYFCSTPTPTYKRWHWQLYSRKLDSGLNAQRSMHTVFICRLFAYVFVQYAHCYLFFFSVFPFIDVISLMKCSLMNVCFHLKWNTKMENPNELLLGLTALLKWAD